MAGAVRYAVAAGAHDAVATWNGGASIPSAGDTVYTNGFVVTGYNSDFDLMTGAPDVNAGSFVTGVFYVIKTAGSTTWTSIGSPDNNVGTGFFATGAGSGTGVATAVGCLTNRSLASPAIAANGEFRCGDGRTLKATVYGTNSGNTAAVIYNGYTSTTIIGDVYPAQFTGSVGAIRLTGGYGILTINGNIKQQQATLTASGYGVFCSTSGPSLVLNGNIEAPTGSGGRGVSMTNGYNCTINGTITGGTNTNAIGLELGISGACTIMGPLSGGFPTAPIITGGTGASAYGVFLNTSSCTCSVMVGSASLPGTITGGSSGIGFFASSAATSDIIVFANMIGAASPSITISGNSKLTATGNITAGSANSGATIGNSGVPVTINGNITGSSTAAVMGLSLNTGAVVTVNGNVTGGSFGGAIGISDTASWYVKVNGDITPGGSASHGLQITGSSTVAVVTGTCYASNATSGNATYGILLTNGSLAYVNKAVGCNYGPSNTTVVIGYGAFTQSTGGGRIYIRKTQQGSGGFPAAFGNIYRWVDDVAYTDEDALYTSGGVNYATLKHRFGDASYVPPTVDKVRLGTSYAFGDMVGTMSVPTSNSVRKGITVDSTTGSICVSASDIWSLSNSTTADSNSLLDIIKMATTPEIAAAITTSFEN